MIEFAGQKAEPRFIKEANFAVDSKYPPSLRHHATELFENAIVALLLLVHFNREPISPYPDVKNIEPSTNPSISIYEFELFFV